MFLAALAALPEDHDEFRVCLAAVPTATGFYKRFGFRYAADVPHSDGNLHKLGVLPITSDISANAYRWLGKVGAKMPMETYTIPEWFSDEPSGDSPGS